MFESVLHRLAEHLERRRIPYMIMGGQAVLAYGVFRSTKDIDVTLGIGPEGIDAVLNLATDCGWKVLPEDPRTFVADTLVLPCVDPISKVRIDFIFSFSPYESTAIARARTMRVGGVGIRYISPEDLIIQKIVAGRPQDLDDVKRLVQKVSGLDLDEVRSWLQQFQAALARPLLDDLEGALRR